MFVRTFIKIFLFSLLTAAFAQAESAESIDGAIIYLFICGIIFYYLDNLYRFNEWKITKIELIYRTMIMLI